MAKHSRVLGHKERSQKGRCSQDLLALMTVSKTHSTPPSDVGGKLCQRSVKKLDLDKFRSRERLVEEVEMPCSVSPGVTPSALQLCDTTDRIQERTAPFVQRSWKSENIYTPLLGEKGKTSMTLSGPTIVSAERASKFQHLNPVWKRNLLQQNFQPMRTIEEHPTPLFEDFHTTPLRKYHTPYNIRGTNALCMTEDDNQIVPFSSPKESLLRLDDVTEDRYALELEGDKMHFTPLSSLEPIYNQRTLANTHIKQTEILKPTPEKPHVETRKRKNVSEMVPFRHRQQNENTPTPNATEFGQHRPPSMVKSNPTSKFRPRSLFPEIHTKSGIQTDINALYRTMPVSDNPFTASQKQRRLSSPLVRNKCSTPQKSPENSEKPKNLHGRISPLNEPPPLFFRHSYVNKENLRKAPDQGSVDATGGQQVNSLADLRTTSSDDGIKTESEVYPIVRNLHSQRGKNYSSLQICMCDQGNRSQQQTEEISRFQVKRQGSKGGNDMSAHLNEGRFSHITEPIQASRFPALYNVPTEDGITYQQSSEYPSTEPLEFPSQVKTTEQVTKCTVGDFKETQAGRSLLHENTRIETEKDSTIANQHCLHATSPLKGRSLQQENKCMPVQTSGDHLTDSSPKIFTTVTQTPTTSPRHVPAGRNLLPSTVTSHGSSVVNTPTLKDNGIENQVVCLTPETRKVEFDPDETKVHVLSDSSVKLRKEQSVSHANSGLPYKYDTAKVDEEPLICQNIGNKLDPIIAQGKNGLHGGSHHANPSDSIGTVFKSRSENIHGREDIHLSPSSAFQSISLRKNDTEMHKDTLYEENIDDRHQDMASVKTTVLKSGSECTPNSFFQTEKQVMQLDNSEPNLSEFWKRPNVKHQSLEEHSTCGSVDINFEVSKHNTTSSGSRVFKSEMSFLQTFDSLKRANLGRFSSSKNADMERKDMDEVLSELNQLETQNFWESSDLSEEMAIPENYNKAPEMQNIHKVVKLIPDVSSKELEESVISEGVPLSQQTTETFETASDGSADLEKEQDHCTNTPYGNSLAVSFNNSVGTQRVQPHETCQLTMTLVLTSSVTSQHSGIRPTWNQ